MSRKRRRSTRCDRRILWRNAEVEERIGQESLNRILPVSVAESHKVEEMANGAVVSRSNNRDVRQTYKTLNGR
jgi:hypothetical protein